MIGHCSKCHKVWKLEMEQGLCPLCGKLASCNTRTQALRSIKSSRRRRKRQDHDPNGYQLQGKWLTYYEVASRFDRKVKAQDREDLLHDIMIALALAQRDNGKKPFTEALMYRIASYTVADYWYSYYKANNGLDCGHCSKAQRQKCREDWLYPECPKAIRLESLSKPIFDGEGNYTELGELIADDRAVDLEAWVDIRTWLAGYSKRLIGIAYKRVNGTPLDGKDQEYLRRFRLREQRTLF